MSKQIKATTQQEVEELKILLDQKNRELEIEAALERVRARTMAMQRSDELAETASLLFQQVSKLGVELWGCSFNIWELGDTSFTSWWGGRDLEIKSSWYIPLTEDPMFMLFDASRKRGDKLWVEESGDEKLAARYRYMLGLPDVGTHLRGLLKAGITFPTFQIDHTVNFSHGNVLFITYEPCPKVYDIFKRFAKVFEQTYTRFLDLQKAEAQAREAQIEAALEKVRSRSLAMHQTNELGEVVIVIVEKLKDLGVVLDANGVILCTYFKESKDVLHWIASPDFSFAGSYLLPYFDHPIFSDAWQSKESGDEYFSKAYSIEDKNGFFEYAFEHSDYKNFPDEFKQWVFQNDQHILSFAWQKNSAILIPSHTGVLPSADDIEILKRFAKVFEQAYTRFLDLQKAEAQAREAQIEAALERVRSRSLAMHKTDELKDVIGLVFEKLRELDVTMDSSCILTFDQVAKGHTVWAANPDLFSVLSNVVPYHDDTIHKAIYDLRADGNDFIDETWTFDEKNEMYDYLFEHTDWKNLPDDLKQAIYNCEGWGFTGAMLKHSATLLVSYSQKKYSEHEKEIIKRFGSVFEQAYIRFLDLQKAEAQAREAQIEAALERVRGRSMAMHKSEELGEVVNTLYEQFIGLGVQLDSINFNIFSKTTRGIDTWAATSKGSYPMKMHFPYFDIFPSKNIMDARDEGIDFIEAYCSKKEKDKWFQYAYKHTSLGLIPDDRKRLIKDSKCWAISCALSKHSAIQINSYSRENFSQKENDILKRFAKGFEQVYVRFLDLQKAEAQTKEARTQTALERIRASAMAMHSSDGLSKVAEVLREQMSLLGQKELESCIVQLYEKGSENYSAYYSFKMPDDPDENMVHDVATVPWRETEWSRKMIEQFTSGVDNFIIHADHSMLKEWYEMLAIVSPRTVELNSKGELIVPDELYYYFSCFSGGLLSVISYGAPTHETKELLNRSSMAFDMAFRRYIDLQKAEGQAREAQIEAALERVRARAMGLHKSAELKEVIAILYNQLKQLGIELYDANIVIQDNSTNALNFWGSGLGGVEMPPKITIPYLDRAVLKKLYYECDSLEKYRAFELKGKELKNYHKIIMRETEFKDAPKEYQEEMLSVNRIVLSYVSIEHGWLEVAGDAFLSKDHAEILQRFGSVVDLTYTRFADLQKAEAQTQEARTQTALERIRASAMAMHSSADLFDVSNVLRDQMGKLGQPGLDSSGIHFYDDSRGKVKIWWAYGEFDNPSVELITGFSEVDYDSCQYIREVVDHYHSRQEQFIIHSRKTKLVEWYGVMVKVASEIIEYDESGQLIVPNELHYCYSRFPGGALTMASEKPFSQEAMKLQKRAAQVFELAYRRFLDLQKAEAQAREAKIETALERIRAKALAMQSSADLHGVSIVLREEMGMLGQPDLESSIVHLYNNARTLESWYTFRSTETNATKMVTDVAFIPVNSCDYIEETLEKYNSKETEYTIVSKGKKLHDWYNVMVKVAPDTIEYNDEGKMLVPEILYYHHSKFLGGALLMISNQPPSEETKELQRRAAIVFNLAYQRFLDLQQAEERTRESIKQASLDRVRGEIASMRAKEDLSRITPLIWTELKTLSVPFIRCGVFIMNEEQQNIESHLSTPDGKSLGVLNLPYNADAVGNNTVKFWKKRQIYKDHWNQKQFVSFMKKMVKLGRLDNPELYQGAALPPKSLDLHFVPFKQGMLYVGNTEALTEEKIQLVSSLAEAFSIAYARYEDFTQLEQAKNQIEHAMGELKSTQSQLIHAEKMASLGELTAGIAHEIQNPLNFVNNFSEVSKELIEEMKEEMDAGNLDDVKEISEDITQNLDKINHHGQRASSIVKGMLEHSRTGKQEKELIDINMLADEYLRLAYHGLRAKDKSFNADFKTNLDEKLPEVKVISQDIGRVLLNMINNAFYAVSTKYKSIDDKSYKPEVTVSTKRNDQSIEICVQDNGGGIPKEALDKIFQPFFTTKPTGEGTGLGLSLSYDIITQGHDGKLNVETEEGKGTRFIIQLPQIEH